MSLTDWDKEKLNGATKKAEREQNNGGGLNGLMNVLREAADG